MLMLLVPVIVVVLGCWIGLNGFGGFSGVGAGVASTLCEKQYNCVAQPTTHYAFLHTRAASKNKGTLLAICYDSSQLCAPQIRNEAMKMLSLCRTFGTLRHLCL